MALNNQRRAPRYLALGLADQPIAVPETAYAEATENNRKSLVGRVLSPRRQDLYSKWEDEQGPDFLNSVPMWLRIRGIPIRYLCEGTVREIASSMGEIMEVELDDVKFDFRFVRVRVNVSVDTRLCFKKVVRFGSGLVWVDVPDPYDRALSPPPLDSSVDGSGEKNGEGGRSLGLLEQIDPADASADAVQGLPDGVGEQKGLDGVEDGNVTQVKVGTSSEGSKRKFDAGDQEDDIVEKRLKGSADAVQDLPNGDGEQGGLDGVEEGNVTLVQSEGVGVNLKPLEEE
ncbi:hypothetical protein ISN45_Aa08g009370 [Arabidopsis thaliana x Arabidopsis arenosa]|uniref:DUF4283 domain-containing protein n=1 Tax=Arabidopsis thaliana x Arabidopsis arenosa TaxID=1240361 RepID=A0A8T1XL47_9BRAS|nr:hypothetical protein ISN45_Aa08g009370 [Arabidopsis thaliana x Arabidopsis arenosa]